MSQKKKILVIDNEEDIVAIISYILTEQGYEIMTTHEADISPFDPDLILLDNWLDNFSGSELCLSLKSNIKTRDIPVILISANSEIRRIASECRANDYIEKPFDIDDLLRIIETNLIGAD